MTRLLRSLPALMLLAIGQRTWGLIYLPENTLESLLVRGDLVAIGTVTEFSDTANRGAIAVEDAIKGQAPASIVVTGVMLRVTTKVSKPRFAKGDRIVVFCAPAGVAGSRTVLHSQTLASAAEVRTMKACIAEVMPVAQVLTGLADPKKELEIEPLRTALQTLVVSKNAYTRILVGRLMGTCLTDYVKPIGWEDVLLPALASPRKELAKGALTWAGKYESLPPAIRAALEKITVEASDGELKKLARVLLEK